MYRHMTWNVPQCGYNKKFKKHCKTPRTAKNSIYYIKLFKWFRTVSAVKVQLKMQLKILNASLWQRILTPYTLETNKLCIQNMKALLSFHVVLNVFCLLRRLYGCLQETFKRIFSIWMSAACVQVYLCPSAPVRSMRELAIHMLMHTVLPRAGWQKAVVIITFNLSWNQWFGNKEHKRW